MQPETTASSQGRDSTPIVLLRGGDDGSSWSPLMGAVEPITAAGLRASGADVVLRPVDDLKAGRVPAGSVITAVNHNHLLLALSDPDAAAAARDGDLRALALWDDPLGATAAAVLRAAGPDAPPAEAMTKAMRDLLDAVPTLHVAWDSGHVEAVADLDLVDADLVIRRPMNIAPQFAAVDDTPPVRDVAFCGNINASLAGGADRDLATVADTVIADRLQDLERSTWEIHRRAADRAGLSIDDARFWRSWLHTGWTAANSDVRRALLRSVPRTVDVFGLFADPDAAPILEAEDGPRVHPSADWRTELPAIYAGTRINLCIGNAIIMRGMPSKYVECVAAGGFALVEPKADLVEHLGPEVREVFFRTADEMNERIEHFLTHERERDDLRRLLRDRVRTACAPARAFAPVADALADGIPGVRA